MKTMQINEPNLKESQFPQNNYAQPQNVSNTSIAVGVTENADRRQSIVNVIFGENAADLMKWAANTFWDGQIIKDEKTGKTLMVPNSEYFKCAICKAMYPTSYSNYYHCRGTTTAPHEKILTEPVDWHPLASRTGLSFINGQIIANINSNIQTANFGKTTNDVKQNTDMDMRLLRSAIKTATAIMGSFLSNKDNYASWLLEDKSYSRLPEVFNIPFLTATMTNLALNLYASYSKGKGMAAVAKVLENRAHIEQEILNKSERSAQEMTTSQSNSGALGGLFNLNLGKK